MIESLFTQIQQFRTQHPDLVVIIYGPTATGKSGLSLRLADLFATTSTPVEIISADSRQVYRFMDIGTDKIALADRQRIPHYAIDIVTPDQEYSAHQRQQDTKKRISDIHQRGGLPMIVGGTGLYIDTIYKNFSFPQNVSANRERRKELELHEQAQEGWLWEYLHQIDPDTAMEFHPKNTRYIIRAIEIYEATGIPKSVIAKEHPVDYPLLMISLTRDQETANKLIRRRVEAMIHQGLIQEVDQLLQQGYTPVMQAMDGIGYRQTIQALEQSRTQLYEELQHTQLALLDPYSALSQLVAQITQVSVQYASRQRKWFRRYENDALHHPKANVHYLNIPL